MYTEVKCTGKTALVSVISGVLGHFEVRKGQLELGSELVYVQLEFSSHSLVFYESAYLKTWINSITSPLYVMKSVDPCTSP